MNQNGGVYNAQSRTAAGENRSPSHVTAKTIAL